MIIYDDDSLELNIEIARLANIEITENKNNIRDKSTLESTFSSCIYYDTNELQASSIVCKLSQNQSFYDGNKRTALFMLTYYSKEYKLKLKKMNDKKLADLILKLAIEHIEPEKARRLMFY